MRDEEAPQWLADERERVSKRVAEASEASLWSAWAAAVAEESRAASPAETPDAERRALLASIALRQGRSDDAWEHFAALAWNASWLVSTLPSLFPGVTSSVRSTWTGEIDGLGIDEPALLAPAFPPPCVPAREVQLGTGRLERRAMEIRGMLVGHATIDLKIAVEYDGLQVDVAHRSGGSARLRIELPEPLDFEIGRTYVDWEPSGEPGQAIAIEVGPEEPARTIFATLKPRLIDWPMARPSELAAGFREHGLRITCLAEDPALVEIESFGRALASLLEAKLEIARVDPSKPPEPFAGLTIDLTRAGERERKMRGLASLAERWALSRRR